MRNTRRLVGAAAAVAAALSAAACTDGEYKHCYELPQPAQQECIAQDNRYVSGGGGHAGYYSGGYWYYGPRTLSDPEFRGVTYRGGGVGGFGESGRGGG